VEHAAQKQSKTFTGLLRVKFKGILDTVGGFLNSLGLTPNTVTILGLVGNGIGAVLIGFGYIQWGGLLVLLMGPLDALDGSMARLRGKASAFGGFLDSVTDRYSELLILAGLMVYYIHRGNGLGCGLVYFAAAGSVLVSYVKARAESLGFDCNVGLLTRVERYLVMAPALLINQAIYGVGIIAVLANFTAFQRIYYVRKQSLSQADSAKNKDD
jgi:CDP-diacylglycerol---glycerol-3-phosphate 3-phosphatidyltransferase